MIVRTAEQLCDRLAEDLIWRKREVTNLRHVLARAQTGHRETLLRAAVTLLYAHWEGFIKVASSAYLEFLHYRRLRYSELAPHFLALTARGLLRKGGATSKIAVHLEIARFFVSGMNEKCVVPYKDGIATKANVTYAVLYDVLRTLGLDHHPYEAKEQLIDERLLRTRNTVAHGEYLQIDVDSWEEVASEVLALLDVFRTQIDNAVALEAYRAAPG